MSACSVDIKQFLEDYQESSESIGDLLPIFVALEPEKPFECITLFDVPGARPHSLTMDKTEKYEYFNVQARIRSNTYQLGWEIGELLKNILHGRAKESWGDSFYALITCSNGPFQLDVDKNQRFRFIVNFNVQRR